MKKISTDLAYLGYMYRSISQETMRLKTFYLDQMSWRDYTKTQTFGAYQINGTNKRHW